MVYKETVEAVFLTRPNRFIATVLLSGKEETVHVKNTGRCKELLIPGCRVILEKSDRPDRKTKYDLIAVYKEHFGLVNMDSQAPNRVTKEWLQSMDCSLIRPEYAYGKSRIDFYIEKDHRKILMEVKGCTLFQDHIGFFPDAPTERGTKHLKELQNAVKEGYEAYIAFVIQGEQVKEVRPNKATDPKFAEAYFEALKNGVRVLFLECAVEENKLDIIEPKKGSNLL